MASFRRMDEPIQIFHFVINDFYVFGNNLFFEKKQVLHNFAFFSCLSNCCIIGVRRRCKQTYFLGLKFGFTASKAFSGKIY